MYSKRRIDLLFRQYVEEGKDEIFGDLMEAVDPMIDVVLKSYGGHEVHFQDLKQEVKLKMWKNQRSPKRLGRSSVRPSIYMFFLIRSYTARAFERIMKIYGDVEYGISFSYSDDWFVGGNKCFPPEEYDDED